MKYWFGDLTKKRLLETLVRAVSVERKVWKQIGEGLGWNW